MLVCAPGQTLCAGVCVNEQADDANCGACAKACTAPDVCSKGACVLGCDTGLLPCGSSCADPMTDALNCGACGTKCPGVQSCVSGACMLVCASPQQDCGGSCIDVTTDNANCGKCGTVCPSGHSCMAGGCMCDGGQTDCSGACVDITKDNANCGGCGTVCGGGETCMAGACKCDGGKTPCSDACVDLTKDNAHCGGCGAVCGGGSSCMGSQCVCGGGKAYCGGACVDPMQDTNNCGGCGTACEKDAACAGGVCSKRVFVTSATFDGNLGGTTGADATCQKAANDATLGGGWKAWLSDAKDGPAPMRLTTGFVGAYTLLDSSRTTIAVGWTAFCSANHMVAISITETGMSTTGLVWTGTTMPFGVSAYVCSDWSKNDAHVMGKVGDSTQVGMDWYDNFMTPPCSEMHHLYCVEQ